MHPYKISLFGLYCYSLALALACASPMTLAQPVDAKLLKRTAACKSTGKSIPAPILIIKLWHPAPSLNTKTGAPAKTPEQAQNLGEVEKQLNQWIQSKSIKSIVAEGCEGSFDDQTSFYGWTLADVRAKAKTPEYDSLLTHPALKLEARYGDQVQTVCGDLKQEIKAELLAFSDARAAAGYAAKIEENSKNPQKQKIYVEGAVDAYKLPADTKPAKVLEYLKAELKKVAAQIHSFNLKRSESLAKTAMTASESPSVIIAGGTHSSQIQKVLEQYHRDCIIYQPLHYNQDEEKLMTDLDRLLK